MIENVSTQLTVFHSFAHCLLPGRAFASLYALLFLEKEAEIGGRAYVDCVSTIFTSTISVLAGYCQCQGNSRAPRVICFRVFDKNVLSQ